MSLRIVKTEDAKTTSAELVKTVITDSEIKDATGKMLLEQFSKPFLVKEMEQLLARCAGDVANST